MDNYQPSYSKDNIQSSQPPTITRANNLDETIRTNTCVTNKYNSTVLHAIALSTCTNNGVITVSHHMHSMAMGELFVFCWMAWWTDSMQHDRTLLYWVLWMDRLEVYLVLLMASLYSASQAIIQYYYLNILLEMMFQSDALKYLNRMLCLDGLIFERQTIVCPYISQMFFW
jgi:hypothetical protein